MPLRDRRILQKNAVPAGQQAPWALTGTSESHTIGSNLMTSWVIDPFDTLPIKMPFKSQELYHYCTFVLRSFEHSLLQSLTNIISVYQCASAFSVAPSDPKDDWLVIFFHPILRPLLITDNGLTSLLKYGSGYTRQARITKHNPACRHTLLLECW